MGCLFLQRDAHIYCENGHPGASIYVNIGIGCIYSREYGTRDVYFWGCLYSLDTGFSMALTQVLSNLETKYLDTKHYSSLTPYTTAK